MHLSCVLITCSCCLQGVERQGVEAVSVRLGGVVEPPQAQLDGFKSRALRSDAPTMRHLYTTRGGALLANGACEAHLTQPGSIANLTIRAQHVSTQALLVAEAAINVQAAGLNFRDVLNVLGLDPTGYVRPIGGEAAGIVATTGPACGHLLRSERAFGLVPGGLRSSARCDARYIRCAHGWNRTNDVQESC